MLRGYSAGAYLFIYNDGVEIGENDHALFAVAGYEEHDGNGEVKGVASASVEGEIPSN
jgi:hypothetical protein